jgi:EmrB/QacA subfamily drug resistance transporter
LRDALRQRLRRKPDGYRYSIGRILVIFSGLMVTIVLAALDQTIVATALPHVVSDIGGLASYSWVFSAYLLFQTATVPIYGKLGDIYGRRTMIMIAISVFVVGSALCGLAQSMPELVVFRCIQGIGAGGLTPLAIATVSELIPPRDRGRYQGLIGAAFGSASILGPALGGLIVDNTTWRWIFYVNLPVAGVAFAMVALTMPRPTRRREHSVDYTGALLLALGIGALLLGLIWGGKTYPWTSGHVLGAVGLSLVLLCAFAAQERRARETILPFEMLKSPTVAAGAACMLLVALCQFGLIAYVPLFAQGVIGVSATSSGVVLTPLMLGSVVASVVAGQVISRTGRYRRNMLVAPLVFATGMTLLWRMDVHTTVAEAARNMFVCGLGLGLMMPVFIIAAQNATPHRIIGATTGFMQFSRSMGTTFGAAVFGVIVNQGLPASVRGKTFVHRLSPRGRTQLSDAIHPGFALGVVLCIVIFVIVFRAIEEKPLRQSVIDPETDAIIANA